MVNTTGVVYGFKMFDKFGWVFENLRNFNFAGLKDEKVK